MSRQVDAIKAWCALESWRYGHKFGPKGPIIIARILNNRVKRGWGTWSQVLTDMPKFSSVNLGEEPGGYPDPYDPNFIRILMEVDKIFAGGKETDDISNESLFFADLSNITRDWFLTTIVRNPTEHPGGGNYGLLTFWD
jgi:hypothetical protein